jgi:putative endopeptidase
MIARRLILAISLAAALSPVVQAADVPAENTNAAKRYGTWGVDLDAMDRSVKPGEDWFRFVNGKWVSSAQIPADKTSIGSFALLRDLSELRVHQILEGWAADKTLKPGSDEAKVAALYRTFMDEAAVEKADAKPLQPYLDAIKAAKTSDDVVKLMGRAHGGFGTSLVRIGIGDDQKNPDRNTVYLSQAGLGLPDRDYYLSEKFKAQKERYQQYVADMLRLAGWNEPEKNAADVVAFETKIAEAHWTRAEGRNRDKTYNPTTVAELEKSAPGFPWPVLFKEAGLAKADQVVVVRQNTAMPKLAKVFADANLDTVKAWEAFHVTDRTAPLLSKRFDETEWQFRSKFLNGVKEERPRWKRAGSAAERALGEAVGRAYVAQYFPPESKAKMESLVADLRTALKGRIQNLEWMSPDTKTKALEKLAKFNVKIGYPTKWRDYSGLQIKEGDLLGDASRIAQFEWKRDLADLNKPVDKTEWGMTPQTVNAYYNATQNEIVFPAAILQPPFFDPKADPAVNYGAIGAVIGHEITHGFDDQGRKSDGNGVLRDWWASDDAAKFETQAAKLGAQYEAVKFPQLGGVHITGRLTMGENIADLGGILMALDAYKVSLKGQPSPVLDGFTGEQRVFLGFGQVWRTVMRDDALRSLLATDPHSPGMIRALVPLQNVDAWYEAFGVKEGDPEYVKPEDRVRIW